LQKNRLRTSKAFIIAAAWLLIITILLCIPGTKLPKINWNDKLLFDKWIHVLLFLILVLVWCWAYSHKKGQRLNAKKIFISITILAILYGVAMEIVQHFFIPFRSFDLADMIADGLGSITGYLISIKRFVKK